MPPIACEKQVLDRSYDRVCGSVVTIERRIGEEYVAFGTGFVMVSDQKQVLTSVHESIVKDGERLFVRFYDDIQMEATIFLRNTPSKHVVLKVSSRPPRSRHHVIFNENQVRRQDVFTISAVERFDERGLMTGSISIPNCKAVRPDGTIVFGSQNLFAMSCPVAGPTVKGEPNGEDLQLVGAAVFDMDGLVIGTVDRVDMSAFDIKYAIKTSSFLNDLERLLKDIDDTIVLSKDQQGFSKGAGTSKQGGSVAGSSRKRGRDDPPGGGGGRRTGGVTLREEGLCMDQLKVNLEVANEEKLRLLKYPVQGDRDVGRKEAMRSELIRLVTRELDDQQSGSLSSPGDMAAPLASAKAGGSTVAPDFEAAAGTMDTCFGKENLGDSSVKLR
ncbi:hypothetical protein CFC21_039742 [Triticum aestivum]|uniref:Uncharacterized protein n=2 Tax=Triticum aestivum TaxID=4565 RepID=A0A9R1FG16_WHEAT|nr:uncharacterized protein LOC123064788 [Triticum aestivum]XP_044344124.1 uncharacterized protein LOC123064788 [Triticum aestivum]XP_044344125.1 uncharacterized protein LOC123064788 [Triticum aestivum]XP_044344126.1 uncharacterized protein LOC123064788 [Triticum aestivum]KAF7027720.1 hypothetical protein CFC21_039741 [Triticum aestivum]KAF7027721.1 hypothetical protein CFC21_039742 [Triticum aestivum]